MKLDAVWAGGAGQVVAAHTSAGLPAAGTLADPVELNWGRPR